MTDSTAKTQINNFIIGTKSLGLWNSMVCWPLRSSQNAGTGTTAYSLGGLGTFNATLLNGLPWGGNGLVKSAAAMQLQLPASTIISNAITSAFVYTPEGTTGYDNLRPFHLGFSTYALDTGILYLYSTSNNTVAVGQSRASVNFFSAPTTMGSGRTFLTNFVLASIRNSDTLLKVNNLSGYVETGLSAKTVIADTSSFIGRNDGDYGANASAFGTYSFGFLFNSDISDESATSLYNLYKTTLGIGLGLP